MYPKVSDLEILQYLARSLPVIELWFIVQIVYSSTHPGMSLLLCVLFPTIGPILINIRRYSPHLNLNLNIVWILASVLLLLLCVVSGPHAPAWYFGISGTIAATFIALDVPLK